jgi:hypothetical protein
VHNSAGGSLDNRFDSWLHALEQRHLADLTFSQVASALRALSSAYVERRQRLREGAALQGAGKRAAFALFYGPLHFLLVREITRALPAVATARRFVIDLGCGTGAAGAAWASVAAATKVAGIDRHPWALVEAAKTYRDFQLVADTRQSDIAKSPLPKGPASIVAAFTLNELDDAGREALLGRLVDRGMRGDQVLIIEPIARGVTPWWARASDIVERAGGRADEWRFRVGLPEIVKKLDRAAHLDHRELTGRSLFLGR